jgi:hypothetical protein
MGMFKDKVVGAKATIEPLEENVLVGGSRAARMKRLCLLQQRFEDNGLGSFV